MPDHHIIKPSDNTELVKEGMTSFTWKMENGNATLDVVELELVFGHSQLAINIPL